MNRLKDKDHHRVDLLFSQTKQFPLPSKNKWTLEGVHTLHASPLQLSGFPANRLQTLVTPKECDVAGIVYMTTAICHFLLVFCLPFPGRYCKKKNSFEIYLIHVDGGATLHKKRAYEWNLLVSFATPGAWCVQKQRQVKNAPFFPFWTRLPACHSFDQSSRAPKRSTKTNGHANKTNITAGYWSPYYRTDGLTSQTSVSCDWWLRYFFSKSSLSYLSTQEEYLLHAGHGGTMLRFQFHARTTEAFSSSKKTQSCTPKQEFGHRTRTHARTRAQIQHSPNHLPSQIAHTNNGRKSAHCCTWSWTID